MKKVLSVYTHSLTTIYLSLSAQVAVSTFFMKFPLSGFIKLQEYSIKCTERYCILFESKSRQPVYKSVSLPEEFK